MNIVSANAGAQKGMHLELQPNKHMPETGILPIAF